MAPRGGPLCDDPDFAGVSFAVPRATVLEVVEVNVSLNEESRTRAVAKYMRWTDGTAIYDEEGFLLPDPVSRSTGITAADLRYHGSWRRVHEQG